MPSWSLNFSAQVRAVDLPVPQAGRWRDVVGNRFRTARHGHVSIALRPLRGGAVRPRFECPALSALPSPNGKPEGFRLPSWKLRSFQEGWTQEEPCHENQQSRDHGSRPQAAHPAAADPHRSRRRREVRPDHPDRGGAAAGVEEIGVVVRPGDEQAYAQVAGHHAGRLHFVHQAEPLGYGHAVYCARDFVGHEPFLHLVGDHLYVSHSRETCAPEAGGGRGSGGLRHLRGAGHPREPAALLRHGGRAPPAGAPGPLRDRHRDREAHAHGGGTAPWCPACAPATTSVSSGCTC